MFFNKSSSFTVAAALDCVLLPNRSAVFDAAAGFALATLSVAVFCCSAAELAAGATLFTGAALCFRSCAVSGMSAALRFRSCAVSGMSAAPATADESAEILSLCWLTVFLSVFTVESSLGALCLTTGFCLTTGSVEVVSASTLWLPPM